MLRVACISVLANILLLPVTLPLVLEPPRAIDGDTFEAVVETRPNLYERVRVRINCYSAPEIRADGGGKLERANLARFLDAGAVLRTHWLHDKYGRLLGEPIALDGGRYCLEDGGTR